VTAEDVALPWLDEAVAVCVTVEGEGDDVTDVVDEFGVVVVEVFLVDEDVMVVALEAVESDVMLGEAVLELPAL